MTSDPPNESGPGNTSETAPQGGWGDQFGTPPNEPQAPPDLRPPPDAGASPFGTDPSGAAAPPGVGQQPAGYPPPGAWPPQQGYAQQGYPQPGYAQQPYPAAGVWGMGAGGPACASCGTPVGATVHCVSCNQMVGMPVGYTLATAGDRFLQALLDGVLAVVTLGIGFLIWSIIVWGEGQTPAMKIMRLRCLRKSDRSVATRGTMALRQIVGGIVQSVLDYFIVGIVLLFMIFWDKDRQILWDKIAGTIVIKEPPGVMPPPAAGQLPYQG